MFLSDGLIWHSATQEAAEKRKRGMTMTNRTQYSSREADQFNLRLPEGLRDKIDATAKSNGRSMNAEMNQRLESSFDAQKQISPVIAELIEKMISDEVSRRLQQIAHQISIN